MISIYYGTRPEYIKLHLLYKRLKEMSVETEMVRVYQHTDLIADCHSDRDVLVKQEQSANRLNCVVASCLDGELIGKNTKMVIVQGDTATAFAVSLNAFNRKIPVAHIEAGLRTFDRCNPFPEEAYRRFISVMGSYHFCVSDLGRNHLLNERVEGNIYVVGNTVLDNIVSHRDSIEYGNKVLVTIHRRENFEIIRQWFSSIFQLARSKNDLEFVIPIHPSINKSIVEKIKEGCPPNAFMVSPLSHSDTIDLIKKCRFVITDSGGIQEESAFLKKKSIVCRKTTERQDGLGTFSVLCREPNMLKQCIDTFIDESPIPYTEICPYGDGTAVEQIAQILKKEYYENLS